LGISIVAVIPYNYFNTRIDKAIQVMEKYATNLEVVCCSKAAVKIRQPGNGDA